MARNVDCEDGEGAAHQSDGAIGMPTCATSVDLCESPPQSGGKVVIHLAVGEARQIIGDRRKPEDAGPTLPCALRCQVSDNTSGFRDPA